MKKKLYVVISMTDTDAVLFDRIWNSHKYHLHCIDNPYIYICSDDDEFIKWFHTELYRESEVY